MFCHDRFFGDDEKRLLLNLARESQEKQTEITDTLGEQIRSAIELFVGALDQADKISNGQLLKDVGSFAEIYEMSLTFMMKLIFMLYAEERGLLPHGEILFDESYGVSHLTHTLELQNMGGKEALKSSCDAFSQLLSAFELIYRGCPHPDLNLPGYGGKLFDPCRFNVLKDPMCQISNDTVYKILRKLSFADAKLGKEKVSQKISYRTISVEHIGYIYEGLIDYTVERAEEPMVILKGKDQAIRPLSELEGKTGAELEKYLRTHTGMDIKAIKKKLDEMRNSFRKEEKEENTLDLLFQGEESSLETDADDNNDMPGSSLRACFYAPFLAGDAADEYFIPAGSIYVTKEGGKRKGQGTYYTPEWVTSFIVERTLRDLVHDEDRKVKIPREILELKVCDPAMGSGAFLVKACDYLANKLVESWDVISHRNNNRLTMPMAEKPSGKISEELIPDDPGEKMMFARRYIADRCLYGVDINPLAVELAKMSLWLFTMAKDRPLEFLDHRFKCGNSIVGTRREQVSEYPMHIETYYQKTKQSEKKEMVIDKKNSWTCWKRDNAPKEHVKIYKKVHDYILKTHSITGTGDSVEHLDLFAEQKIPYMDEAREHLAHRISKINSRYIFEQDKKREDYEALIKSNDYLGIKRIYDFWSSLWFWDMEGVKDVIDVPLPRDYESFQWTLYNGRKAAEKEGKKQSGWLDVVEEISRKERFFHWEIEFPDVFEGEEGGFDAVVGNPPYVRQEKLKQYKCYFTSIFETSVGTSDLFVYFYELGYKNLKPDGYLGMISSNTYLKTASGYGLRKFLKDRTTVEDFVDFGDLQIFRGVTTYPAVMIFRKSVSSQNHRVRSVQLKDLDNRDIKEMLKTDHISFPQAKLDDSMWQFEDLEVLRLREKIFSQGVPLREYCGEPYFGIKIGLNEAFVIPGEVRDRIITEDLKSEERLKPFLEGKDISPWKITPRDIWLIFFPKGWTRQQMGSEEAEPIAWNWLKEEYPGIANWLRNFRDQARIRQDKGDYWWELRACEYYDVFEKPKIIWPEISNKMKFNFDSNGIYTNQTIYSIPTDDLHLLGLLNSRLMWFVVKKICIYIRNNYYRLLYMYTQKFPIKQDENGEIVDLVSSFLRNSQLSNISSEQENRLNEMVYDLYDLSEEERMIINRLTDYLYK